MDITMLLHLRSIWILMMMLLLLLLLALNNLNASNSKLVSLDTVMAMTMMMSVWRTNRAVFGWDGTSQRIQTMLGINSRYFWCYREGNEFAFFILTCSRCVCGCVFHLPTHHLKIDVPYVRMRIYMSISIEAEIWTNRWMVGWLFCFRKEWLEALTYAKRWRRTTSIHTDVKGNYYVVQTT